MGQIVPYVHICPKHMSGIFIILPPGWPSRHSNCCIKRRENSELREEPVCSMKAYLRLLINEIECKRKYTGCD